MRNAKLVRTIAIVDSLMYLAASDVRGGAVVFEPSGITVPHGQTVTMTVTLQPEWLDEFSGVDILMGSDTAPFTFQFSDAFIQVMPRRYAIEYPSYPVPPPYSYSFIAGGINLSESVGQSLELGQLTFATGGLAHGSHTIEVNWDAEDHGFGGMSELVLGLQGRPFAWEPLYGTGRFTVAPEPNMLLTIILAGAVLIGRRRLGGMTV